MPLYPKLVTSVVFFGAIITLIFAIAHSGDGQIKVGMEVLSTAKAVVGSVLVIVGAPIFGSSFLTRRWRPPIVWPRFALGAALLIAATVVFFSGKTVNDKPTSGPVPRSWNRGSEFQL